jgi:hypothetical protein
MSESLDNLIHPDSEVSDRVLKHWLKVYNLQHTADTKEKLQELLGKLISEGKLTRDELNAAIREIEEIGGKRIFLRYLADKRTIRSQEAFEDHLKSIRRRLDKAPTATIYKPERPVINYISWEPKEEDKAGQKPKRKRGDRIRVKFSETHLKAVGTDLTTGTVEVAQTTKFVIATVELGTGFTCIFVDYPGDEHPHKDRRGRSRRELYEQFYFDWVTELFDAQALIPFDLTPAADRLMNGPSRIFRIPYETVITGGKSRQTYSSVEDVIKDPARQGAEQADGSNWQFEELSGYWLPAQSGGLIERELFTQIVRANSVIRVLADCLASEVEYVISKLR